MIEKDFVIGIFHPDPDILKAYEIQKNMDDQAQKGFIVDRLPKTKTNPSPESGMENILRMVKDKIDQERKNIEEYFEDGNSFLEDMVDAADEEVTLINDDIEQREFKGGKVYDPRRGREFKANIYLKDNGNLKVEGCLAFICDDEEWLPLVVTINADGTKEASLKSPPEDEGYKK